MMPHDPVADQSTALPPGSAAPHRASGSLSNRQEGHWDEVPLHQLSRARARKTDRWSFAMLFATGVVSGGCSTDFGMGAQKVPKVASAAPGEDTGPDSQEPESEAAEADAHDSGEAREEDGSPRSGPQDPDGHYDGSTGGHGGDEPEENLAVWGEAVVTMYTFQDNSACNSMMTATGLPLVPYVSVALPRRFLSDFGGGPHALGDTVYVAFLDGRTMPDGSQHTGWVRIDDYCGDHGDDGYCLQGGLPNVDLYIGDWATSGMRCDASDLEDWGSGGFTGPAGDGHEPTTVSFGPAPEGALADSYGGHALGEGDCGDCAAARDVQPPACWHYDPGDTNIQYCDCDNSNGRDGECD